MEESNENDRLVYEVGYHILPTIEESAVPEEADKIKSAIAEKGGSIISEETPKIMNLAYDISKSVNAKKQSYSKAYFGWTKFEVEPEAIADIKSKIDTMGSILRFLIIKTVKADTMRSQRVPSFKKENNKDKNEEEKGEAQEISEEEIDKSIDELLVEDNKE